jgi:hypothetical protein
LLLDRAGSTDLRSFSKAASKRRVGHSGNRKRRKRFPKHAEKTLSVGESTKKKKKKKKQKQRKKKNKKEPVAFLRFPAVITAFA